VEVEDEISSPGALDLRAFVQMLIQPTSTTSRVQASSDRAGPARYQRIYGRTSERLMSLDT
jgi:hypothetical protein